MKKFRSGLIVGKFSPLHLGHEFLISTAAEQCETLTILNYAKPALPGCPVSERQYWLSEFIERFSNVQVHILDSDLPDDLALECEHRAFCANYLLHELETTVDAVFSSESYGEPFAHFLSQYFSKYLNSPHTVTHVMVDLARNLYPTSGTQIRNQVFKNSGFLSPTVLGSFIPRVAILGGESSGKTTLTTDLSNITGFNKVNEYGRELFEKLNGQLRFEDMTNIGEMQIKLERHEALRHTRKTKNIEKVFLFCDTTPLTTSFYSNILFGRSSRQLQKMAEREYQYFILCKNDIPFDQDGTRQDEDFRDRGYTFYKNWLTKNDLQFLEVSGNREERVRLVLDWIPELCP